MSNGYWVSKDGLRIPKRDNAQRKLWDASYLARLKDYFGDDKDNDYEPALLPVADIEGNHTVFESNPRIPFYSRLYRQNVHEVPPILVTQGSDGRYQMRDGNHRHAAAQRAGVSHIPALIQRPKKSTKTKSSSPHVFTGTKAKKLGEKPMKKSEEFHDLFDLSKHEREAPPELPKRIVHALWALRQPGVLTDELRQPKYRSNPDPFAGHCFVATNALFHLINGPQTGWDMKCIHKEHMEGLADDTHWFLQHRKTGHIIDPTADQFDETPPYEKAVSKGTSQTGDDVGKPTKRAQVVIDRAKSVMSEAPKEYLGTLEHDGQDWYIKPPAMKKAEEKRISLDEAHKLYNWFHISHQEPDENGQFRATPMVPRGAGINIEEDDETPRICVGPSIHHCIAGLHGETDPQEVREEPSLIDKFKGMHVYGIRMKPHQLQGRGFWSNEDVSERVADAHKTGEAWLTKPTTFEHVGQLRQEKTQRGNTIPAFDYGPPHLAKAEPKPKPKLSVGLPAYRSPDGKHEEWDYSHLLPQKTRDEGYRIKLRSFSNEQPTAWASMGPDFANQVRNRLQLIATKTQDGRSRPAGMLSGEWSGKTVRPWESSVEEQDRRKHLGLAMYEAMYAHARVHLGATEVAGDYHSTSAHLLHRKLALKHGLNYEAKPNVGKLKGYSNMDEWRETPAHDSDGKYDEYKYKLPDVLKPKQVNSFAEHKLPGSLHAEGYRLNIAHSPDTTIGTIHRRGEVLGHIELTPKGHAFEEWTGANNRVGLRDAALSVLRGHAGGESAHDEWNNVSKPSKAPQPLGKAEPTQSFEEGPADGSHITAPHQSYTHGAAAKPFGTEYEGGKNVWGRQHTGKSNKGRTLMVQFSTHLLQGGRKPDEADAYYDKLYSKREGYHRGQDFWEVPQWQSHLAHSLPNADHYTVRDPEEAIKFMGAAGYDHVAFSALDVNKDFVRRLAQGAPNQHVVVGGYTDMNHFGDLKNVSVHPSIKSFVESEGHTYQPGYDYRHFTGMKTIPRLTLSDGCRHNCTFCCVPKQVDEKSREEILQQADSFAEHLPSDLIYLNDKTFGQAKNHAMLPELYQRIKAKNPAFRGFVIQTTAAQMKRFTPEFMKAAGIKHVELGVESVNDPILKAHKKPATEAIIEDAANKVRAAGASLIPNIMVGLPGEDRSTYARTLGWLQKHRDIISHVNAYNLALYDDSELGKKLQVINDADRDENVQQKSWHTDPQAHADFAKALFGFANGQLDQPIGHTPLEKTSMEYRIARLRERKPLEKDDDFYHGTTEQFDNFEQRPGHVTSVIPGLASATSQVQRSGFFFTRSPQFAQQFAGPSGRVVKAKLDLGNTIDVSRGIGDADINRVSSHMDAQGLPFQYADHFTPGNGRGKKPWHMFDGEHGSKVVAALKAAGYNSAKFEEEGEDGEGYETHVVFHPEQIRQTGSLTKAAKAFMKSPAFRHASSGKVIATPILHDRDVLASKLKLPADHESLYSDWEAGFIDHANNFYDREAALAAVTKQGQQPVPKLDYLESIPGLESEQYTAGREKGVFKAEVDHHDPVSCVVMVQDSQGRTLWGKRKDGTYTMPAGHADAHEHPADCANRELMEEAGLKAEALWLIGSGNGDEGPVHVYHAISHGQPRTDLDPDREMSSWEWVDCLRGPPEHITAHLAHRPDIVYSLMGWGQPGGGEPLDKAESLTHEDDEQGKFGAKGHDWVAPHETIAHPVASKLVQRHGGKVMGFGRLPDDAKRAVLTHAGEHGGDVLAARGEYHGYANVPMSDLIAAVMRQPGMERYKSFDSYHKAWAKKNKVPDYGKSVWPVVLNDEYNEDDEQPYHELIRDGWHRLHGYYRAGVKTVPVTWHAWPIWKSEDPLKKARAMEPFDTPAVPPSPSKAPGGLSEGTGP